MISRSALVLLTALPLALTVPVGGAGAAFAPAQALDLPVSGQLAAALGADGEAIVAGASGDPTDGRFAVATRAGSGAPWKITTLGAEGAIVRDPQAVIGRRGSVLAWSEIGRRSQAIVVATAAPGGQPAVRERIAVDERILRLPAPRAPAQRRGRRRLARRALRLAPRPRARRDDRRGPLRERAADRRHRRGRADRARRARRGGGGRLGQPSSLPPAQVPRVRAATGAADADAQAARRPRPAGRRCHDRRARRRGDGPPGRGARRAARRLLAAPAEDPPVPRRGRGRRATAQRVRQPGGLHAPAAPAAAAGTPAARALRHRRRPPERRLRRRRPCRRRPVGDDCAERRAVLRRAHRGVVGRRAVVEPAARRAPRLHPLQPGRRRTRVRARSSSTPRCSRTPGRRTGRSPPPTRRARRSSGRSRAATVAGSRSRGPASGCSSRGRRGRAACRSPSAA